MHCRQIFLLSEPPGKLFNQTKKKKKKKKKEILLFAIAWTKLEGIMPGEICQREKDKHYTISLNMCNLEKQIRTLGIYSLRNFQIYGTTVNVKYSHHIEYFIPHTYFF